MKLQDLTQTLVESFHALADEVQSLSDRQTVLEHKLRYAHEQFQYLADRYSPAAPEISETLVNLQIPPETPHPSLANTNLVPLPKRKPSDSKHQIAVIIREGRRVASSLSDFSKSSRSSRDPLSPTNMTSSLGTILEQDFTVEGKKGMLGCPFSQTVTDGVEVRSGREKHTADHGPTLHHSSDPICAAMFEESTSQPAPSANGQASKCPIRYMDQHSPEEIAHYLETHKHELPRSHEVCVRRYQRNEEHIRKLDAKYGNLVNMVEGLSRIHQPMLPERDTRPQSDVENGSNERVETWAQTVIASAADDPECVVLEDAKGDDDDDDERQSHFDRPLKEIRVGESPSRPWGISVPVYGTPSVTGDNERPDSPPPAPVRMPSASPEPKTPTKRTGKCPFDHTKLLNVSAPAMPKHETQTSLRLGDIPMDVPMGSDQPFTPATQAHDIPPPPTTNPGQPVFLDAADFLSRTGDKAQNTNTPQMLFTGPVFIGYPIEQAIQFMQHFQGQK